MHDAHDALRGPKTPPPGVRPGSLAEPAPQRSDRSLRRSSGETPLLGVPSLADPLAEASDGRKMRFLLTKPLALKEEEDEESRKQEEQEELNSLSAMERRTPQQNRRLADLFLQRAKRKRRKRRKRRAPRTSSPAPLVAALVVDSGSGMLAMLVFLVMLLLVLCFLLSLGLRCSASWSVCTRRTVARSSSIPA